MTGANFFIGYQNLKAGKYGQTAVFLLIALIILLIAAVSLINIGRTGIKRGRTANAADSAAIATASALGGVAMNISQLNYETLIPMFPAFQLALLLTGKDCVHLLCQALPTANCPTQSKKDLTIFKFYCRTLLFDYLFLMYTTRQGFGAARAAGFQLAFSNVGIEEAQKRRRGTGEILVSDFSKWLTAKSDEMAEGLGNREKEMRYTWNNYSIDPISGKETRESAPNEVIVNMKLSDCAFALDPWPALPATKIYKYYPTGKPGEWVKVPYPPYLIPVACKCWQQSYRNCYNKDKQGYQTWLRTEVPKQNLDMRLMLVALVTMYLVEMLINIVQGCPVHAMLGPILITVMLALGVPLIWFSEKGFPPMSCASMILPKCGPSCLINGACYGKPAQVTFIYIVPVPFIRDIVNDDEIGVWVTVTHIEPGKDLGFFQRRGATVTSKARSKMWTTGPFLQPKKYKAFGELTATE